MGEDVEDTLPAESDELEQKTVFADPPAVTGTDPGNRTELVRDTQPDAAREAEVATDVPPAEPEAIAPDRTSFAQEGMRIGVLLAYRFAKRRFGRPPRLSLRLSDPGLSTGGGVAARQSILLAAGTKSRGNTVIGWLDTSRSQASLRTYALLESQHAQRHKASFDVPRDEYERLHEELCAFFAEHAITLEAPDQETQHVAAGAAPSEDEAEAPSTLAITPRKLITVVILILCIGILLGALAARVGTGDAEEEEPPSGLRDPLERYRKPQR